MPDIYAKGLSRKQYDKIAHEQKGKERRMRCSIRFIEHNGGVITWPNGKPETNDEIRGLSE